jgi:CheY-like chemotaxis protein
MFQQLVKSEAAAALGGAAVQEKQEEADTVALADNDQGEAADESGPGSLQAETPNPLHIPSVLIIEDNPGDVELTMLAFQTRGLTADFRVAINGSKAIEYLQLVRSATTPWRPDLILLDLGLPVVTGRDVLAFIKGHVELADIPTVVLTASKAELDWERCSTLGADAFLTKPMTLQELLNMMKEIEPMLGI